MIHSMELLNPTHTYFTSFKQTKEKSFTTNLLNNELPTLHKITIRRPDLYTDSTPCYLCQNQQETITHLFDCPMLQQDIEMAWNKSTAKLEQAFNKLEDHPKQIAKQNQTLQIWLNAIRQQVFQSAESLHALSVGLIENRYITDLAKIQGATKPIGQKAQLLVETLCKRFKKHFRNLAWINRCNKVAEIDRIKGITRAEKRKEKRFKTNAHHKTRNKKEEKRHPIIMKVQRSRPPCHIKII